jgi:hypothetical protein
MVRATPFPRGSGWRKVAAAVALVHSLNLAAGKTFNSQAGGGQGGAEFHALTLQDWHNTTAALAQAGVALDGMMVETWYNFPREAAPESTPFTTAYTALAVASAQT